MNDINKPFVSVLIDSYNYGHFIEETIESVLNQSLPQENIEIIVVDDGSKDDTSDRVKKYKDKIKFIQKANEGQASALNVAFENSKGEIIFLLDSDDIFYPDKISEVCDIYEKYNCNVVYNGLEIFGKNIKNHESETTAYFLQFISRINQYLYKLSANDNFSSFLFLAETSGQSYRRDLLDKIMPIPKCFFCSADLYLHVLPLIYDDIYYLNKKLSGFRQHQKNYRTVNYSESLVLKDLDTNFYKYTIDSLNKYINNTDLPEQKKAKCLARSLENRINYINYHMEKYHKNTIKALYHMLKYKPSQKSTISRFVSKTKYIMELVSSELSDRIKRGI